MKKSTEKEQMDNVIGKTKQMFRVLTGTVFFITSVVFVHAVAFLIIYVLTDKLSEPWLSTVSVAGLFLSTAVMLTTGVRAVEKIIREFDRRVFYLIHLIERLRLRWITTEFLRGWRVEDKIRKNRRQSKTDDSFNKFRLGNQDRSSETGNSELRPLFMDNEEGHDFFKD